MSGENKEGAPQEARPDDEAREDGPMNAEDEHIIAETEDGPAGDFDEDVDETAALRAEAEEMRGNMLRALAEAENVRRRATRDVADARQYAVTAFARDILNVADNFRRALSLIEDRESLPEEVKGLVEGIDMTGRELASVLERHGVKIIEPVGERFDPNRHQAMFEVENPDVASGTVMQVVQAGAMIGDRTLRPAMVGVSKGGPKPEPKAETGSTGDAA
ncbi:nucleotide exchange factor GrpE [Acuticoccus sp. MNP-M23]|uniref:nucleotide exchange factor GrpE n=1 Tax=Acuticoccus sp. MNP-M23 TaxID=3072793 RepID=UPI002815B573|nr:nucleotide exchange factor GrpE [Acuticoccus sp. MNP-M23]WMS44216.1 nucleotide exchange factor GrpE [Acuticoccus sp. MNP-M23]